MKTKIASIITLFFLLITPMSLMYAQNANTTGADAHTTGKDKLSDKATGGSLGLSIHLDNPINDTDIMSLIDRIVGVVLKVGIPIIALFLLWAGFQYVMARGNEKKITDAHRNLGHVLLGTAIFLGAYAIAKAIIATVNLITS
ncbi:MAG: hypothetical protein WCO58_01765 [bacterium]